MKQYTQWLMNHVWRQVSCLLFFFIFLLPSTHVYAAVDQISYLYVADFETDHVFRCSLSSGGFSGACATLSELFGPVTVGIAFSKAANGTLHGYVLGNGGHLYECLVTAQGDFDACHITPHPPGGWSPIGIAFSEGNTGELASKYAYVVDNSSNQIYQCPVNTSGALGVCQVTPADASSHWFPVGITIATVNHHRYAYIPSTPSPNSFIYRCPINADGTFAEWSDCLSTIPAHIDPYVWGPQAIAFALVRAHGVETQYAYVADGDGGNVYQCTLDTSGTASNGTLSSCQATPAAGAPGWFPSGITFVTVEGKQMAYVADGHGSGLLFQCMLNDDGTFRDCHITPSLAPWVGVFGTAISSGGQ